MAGAAQHFENSHADSLAGAALCEHPCRFRGRHSTLCTSMRRCRGRSNTNALLCGEIANVRNAVFFNRTGGSEAGKSRKENWRLSSTGDILLVHGNGLLKFACIHEGHSKDYYVEDSWRTFLQ